MLNWISGILKNASKDKLYGSITLTFQNGKITNCKVERSIKPPVDLKDE